VSAPDLQARVETITPEVAKKMLGTMRKNRPLSDAKVIEYAVAMEAGKWELNAETIKFDSEGRLFDGQHRLQGCILAEKPFRSLVVRGIAGENAFATVDVGKNRSHGDVFGIAGFSNPSLVASVTQIVFLHQKAKLSWNGPTNIGRFDRPASASLANKIKKMPGRSADVPKEDLLAFAEPLGEGLVSAARFAEQWKQPRLLPRALAGGGYYLFRDKSFDDAEAFFRDLDEGAGLMKTDPVYHLRERLISNSQADAKLSRWMVLGFMFKTWNKRRAGETVRYLKVSDGEEFPRKLV
jgi:hypothetical protein